MKQESLLGNEFESHTSGPVECLGMTFENDEARRTHFTVLLRDKLKDLEFRAIEGFPIGTDEAILELSDPPYYTACPNPWLNDFVELWESQKADIEENYHREPFAADVSEGKNDPIYNAHSYHTKVPHKAIMRYILHYTKPGDIVFDGFCGTGMTGVAAQMCGVKEEVIALGYNVLSNGIIQKKETDQEGNETWVDFSELGVRKAILNDLSPAATSIASNFNKPVDIEKFQREAKAIHSKVEKELGWMFETNHNDGQKGKVNFTIWSDVFSCPECGGEVVFWDDALDASIAGVKDKFNCRHCHCELNKRNLERVWENVYDPFLNETLKFAKEVPSLINYTVNGKRYEKKPDENDLTIIRSVLNDSSCDEIPMVFLPDGYNLKQPKRSHGLTHVHHFYTRRNLKVLGKFWHEITQRTAYCPHLKLWFTSAHAWGTRLNRLLTSNYFKKRGGVIGQTLQGTLYISSLSVETNIIERFYLRIKSSPFTAAFSDSVIETSSMSYKSIEDNSLDYIFVDPPFGANIMYSDLNILWESWLGPRTNIEKEAIENSTQGKTSDDYRDIMSQCFKEAYRLLKSGRWMTVEFSNTKASTWNNIQTAISGAGFVISNVSALEKKHKGFKAVTTPTAVKQDLVISAYKPDESIEQCFKNDGVAPNSVWDFVEPHLRKLPIIRDGSISFVPEREPRILFDRMVSFYVQRGLPVPLSSSDFQSELKKRLYERNGMIFLSEQIAAYEIVQSKKNYIIQRSIFVDDEISAIDWMRQELKDKPKTYSEIHPLFLNELSGWKKNELSLELSTLLEQNFLKYDGMDEVPSQIHTYLSTNFKDMRGLDKSDSKLKAKAKDRWYVPDPNKAADLEKVRLRALLKEFETYKAEKKKIKQPRAEALRAGFNRAWEAQVFQTILDVSAKIPPAVLQEDEKLLMFYDNALTLTSTEDDEW
ncbi:DNA methyltransferase [Enterovibrio sp. 27052020O]|uniref:DNA methyltransferase n=1 Tax=Enterovibrio sp. 27052020O TaxID=3241166 RepID=UPI0038908FD2